jgi:hypothetical protein
MEDIEDICLFVCKMKLYFFEWTLNAVFSRVATSARIVSKNEIEVPHGENFKK